MYIVKKLRFRVINVGGVVVDCGHRVKILFDYEDTQILKSAI